MQNISDVVKNDLCTGCGTCAGLCPQHAIDMVVDEKRGIYIPRINEEKCTECGICYKICPGHEVDFEQLNQAIFGKQPDDTTEGTLLGTYHNCYVGHSTDYDVRYNCSSGGLVTQLLIFALEEGIIDGALVTRMKKEKPLEPESFIARTKEDIFEARGSKYCPVPANTALREILDSKEGEKFAVVGLPCHIHGIRKAEQVNKKPKEKIVLHLGIFCGTTKTFHATEIQLKRMGIVDKDVKKIAYRGNGWPGSMTVQLKKDSGKDTHKALSHQYLHYYDAKFSSFNPWRCLTCIDEIAELADVSFGDAWIPELKKSDSIGMSIIIARNLKTEDLLQKAIKNKKIELNPIAIEKLYETQSAFSLSNSRKNQLKTRRIFSKILNKNIPRYNYNFKYKSSPQIYLSNILIYSKEFLASKQNLWWFLDVYLSLLRYLANIMHKLKTP